MRRAEHRVVRVDRLRDERHLDVRIDLVEPRDHRVGEVRCRRPAPPDEIAGQRGGVGRGGLGRRDRRRYRGRGAQDEHQGGSKTEAHPPSAVAPLCSPHLLHRLVRSFPPELGLQRRSRATLEHCSDPRPWGPSVVGERRKGGWLGPGICGMRPWHVATGLPPHPRKSIAQLSLRRYVIFPKGARQWSCFATMGGGDAHARRHDRADRSCGWRLGPDDLESAQRPGRGLRGEARGDRASAGRTSVRAPPPTRARRPDPLRHLRPRDAVGEHAAPRCGVRSRPARLRPGREDDAWQPGGHAGLGRARRHARIVGRRPRRIRAPGRRPRAAGELPRADRAGRPRRDRSAGVDDRGRDRLGRRARRNRAPDRARSQADRLHHGSSERGVSSGPARRLPGCPPARGHRTGPGAGASWRLADVGWPAGSPGTPAARRAADGDHQRLRRAGLRCLQGGDGPRADHPG